MEQVGEVVKPGRPRSAKAGRKARGVFWRDGEWWIRWACTLGHDHRKPSGELKTAATEEHKAKRAEVREARKIGRECCPRLLRREQPLLFDDLVKDYLEYSRRSKRSHTDDRPRAERLLGRWKGRLATDVTSKDVEDFKAHLAETLTPSRKRRVNTDEDATPRERQPLSVATVNHHLKLLKAVYNRAIRAGRVPHNPVAPVKLYQEHNARNRCLTPEEEARLLAALPARLRPFMILALNTGMRRGELQALRWDDVDLAAGTLRIRRDKAGEGRWAVLNSDARVALVSVKREQKILGAYVFCSPEGKLLHNFERDWKPALRAAKIPDFRFHDCRHTFASRLAMLGTDLYTVQRAGGWKTQVMVQRYAHLSPDHIKAAVEQLARSNSGRATGTKTGTGETSGESVQAASA
jgi:integrase